MDVKVGDIVHAYHRDPGNVSPAEAAIVAAVKDGCRISAWVFSAKGSVLFLEDVELVQSGGSMPQDEWCCAMPGTLIEVPVVEESAEVPATDNTEGPAADVPEQPTPEMPQTD